VTKKKGSNNKKIKPTNDTPIELSEEEYSITNDESLDFEILENKNQSIKRPDTRGRPKSSKGFKKIAQNSAIEVMQFLLNVVRDDESSTRDRILASKELLDRGFGKSLQEVQSNNNNTIRVILDTTLKKLAE
jgi:hypothetical protein